MVVQKLLFRMALHEQFIAASLTGAHLILAALLLGSGRRFGVPLVAGVIGAAAVFNGSFSIVFGAPNRLASLFWRWRTITRCQLPVGRFFREHFSAFRDDCPAIPKESCPVFLSLDDPRVPRLAEALALAAERRHISKARIRLPLGLTSAVCAAGTHGKGSLRYCTRNLSLLK
jgi:hypothetical protein